MPRPRFLPSPRRRLRRHHPVQSWTFSFCLDSEKSKDPFLVAEIANYPPWTSGLLEGKRRGGDDSGLLSKLRLAQHIDGLNAPRFAERGSQAKKILFCPPRAGRF